MKTTLLWLGRNAERILVIGLMAAVFGSYIWGTIWPVHHKYSDVPGQDRPYCPPDPKECD